MGIFGLPGSVARRPSGVVMHVWLVVDLDMAGSGLLDGERQHEDAQPAAR